MSFVDLLQQRSGDAFIFLEDGESESARLSYAELDARAQAVAAALHGAGVRPDDRVLILVPAGPDFLAAFFGCLYAGAWAVPTYPPDLARPQRTWPRLYNMVKDAEPRALLTIQAFVQAAESLPAETGPLRQMQWISVDTLPRSKHAPTPSDVALLQYTSGSTSEPRGVIVTHANLLANAQMTRDMQQPSEHASSVTWLPPFHDMGLIEGLLQPIYSGYPVRAMPPQAFLQRPLRWLHAISRARAEITGAPNFAFELCARKATPADVAALDLSSLRFAYCGAEPVRQRTLEAFTQRFAACGLDANALRPVYGLAEATLVVTSRRRGEPIAYADGHVGVGRPLGDTKITIANPGQDGFGEICISGSTVARGYFRQPPFDVLHTGDLGFMRDGELFVGGRIKDLIIVRGRNVFPQDLELVAEQAGARPGCAAAFERGDDVCLVAEASQPDVALARRIAQAVNDASDVAVATVVLLAPGELPKTSSGKVQRRATYLALEAGTLPVAARYDAPRIDPTYALQWLAQRGIHASVDQPLAAAGADSLARAELLYALEEKHRTRVDSAAVATVVTLADALALFAAESAPLAVDEADGSVGQQALVYLQTVSPETVAYNIHWAMRLDTPISQADVARVVARHPLLHTLYRVTEHGVVTEEAPVDSVQLERFACSDDAIDAVIAEQAATPFVLSERPAFRVCLLGERTLLVVFHHVIADLRSIEIVVHELVRGCTGSERGFAEYVAEEGAYLATAGDDALERWRKLLRGAKGAIDIRSRADGDHSRRAGVSQTTLGPSYTARLREDARAAGVTPFTLLLSRVAQWLGTLSGQRDLCIGVATSLRTSRDARDSVGYFVNLLPVRVRLEGDVLAATARALAESSEGRLVPFARLVEALKVPRDERHMPLVNVSVSYQQLIEGSDFIDRAVPVTPAECALDLELSLLERTDRIEVTAVYRTDRIDAEAMSSWLELLQDDSAAGVHISRPLLAPAPWRVPERFAAQSERVARWLVSRGVRPGQRVGLCVEPSDHWVAAMLGVWRAGASITPFHPEHPTPFLRAQLERSRPLLVLRKTDVTTEFPIDTPMPVHELDHIEDVAATLPPFADGEACALWTDLDLREVTYSHAQLQQAATDLASLVSLATGDVMLLRAASQSVWAFIELLMALQSGASLYVADGGDIKCPGLLGDHIAESSVSHVSATPSQLRGLLNAMFDAAQRLAHVRCFLLHGEPMGDELRRRLQRYAPNARVVDVLSSGLPLAWREAADPAFIPFSSLAVSPRGARLPLPSGDTARTLPDGRLELGPRTDRVVKIAGERVDLAVLERVLRRDSRVREVRCEASADARGDMRIAAYVVLQPGIAASAVKDSVREQLPQAYWLGSVHALGRLDGELPAPPWRLPDRPRYEPPQSEREQILARIWGAVLGQPRISRHDNFFEIGGDSLLSMHVVHEAQRQGLPLTAAMMVRAQVLATLAQALDQLMTSNKG